MTHAHKIIMLLLAALATIAIVSANLQVSGVYYDPVQAENGGEAIMLENNGNEPAFASTLITKQSSIPLSVTLLPGQGYLIADTGWSLLKDNASWPDADLEIGLSLANTDGFVEIRNGNETLDRLAWNTSNGSKASEGYLFTHDGEMTPLFRNSNTTITDIPATIIVLNGPPIITAINVTDDSNAPGIQLLSYARNITVSATIQDSNNESIIVSASLLGKEYELEQNGSTFTTTIPLDALAPGNYELRISASDGTAASTKKEIITVLPSTSISITGPITFRGLSGSTQSANFTIKNQGNTNKNIRLAQLPDAITCDLSEMLLVAGNETIVFCSALVPETAPGIYTYTLKLFAS